MTHSGFIQILVTHHLLQIQSRKQINTNFYESSVIAFISFSELLWKYILLVCYKLNILPPPKANQFDICALLFSGYARILPLDKMVYIVNGSLNSGS